MQDKISAIKITKIREKRIANSFYPGSATSHAYIQSSSNPLEIFHYLCKLFTTFEHTLNFSWSNLVCLYFGIIKTCIHTFTIYSFFFNHSCQVFSYSLGFLNNSACVIVAGSLDSKIVVTFGCHILLRDFSTLTLISSSSKSFHDLGDGLQHV